MIKVKLESVKRDDEKQNFSVYPFSIKRDNIIINGVVKLDIEEKKICVKVLEYNIKSSIKKKSYISLLDTNIGNYCLNKEEKIALMKEIFYIFVYKQKTSMFSMSNQEIAMFEFEEENGSEDKTTLLNEFLKYKETDFNDSKKRERLIANLVRSIKIFKTCNLDNIKSDEVIELQFIKYLNSNERLYYIDIFNEYLKQEYKDFRVGIEKCRRIGKLLVYCFKLKKYTITPLFPNKEIEENALRNFYN